MNNKNAPIILLAGFACAGKTTIATRLSEKFKVNYIGTKPLFDEMTTERGYVRTRDWLHEVGEDRFIDETILAMLSKAERLESDKPLVIDAVYGRGMVRRFNESFPGRRVVVVRVDADEDIRETRMTHRMGGVEREVAKRELNFRDGFLSEAGLERVIEYPDLRIENRQGNLEGVTKDLIKELDSLGIQI
jgi:cytidylate kinase